ncbi:Transmembrane amino acid transporter protein [Popillia japonica]|uniref:Transmembrane amino acid transporter protein n=1 Tax=Popillia japonica TaxID=7064 RepID=A0AAW1HUG1_POPJA
MIGKTSIDEFRKSRIGSIFSVFRLTSEASRKDKEHELHRAPLWFKRRMMENDYDPHKHRKQTNLSPNIETTLHIIKSCTGTGILAMPYGFKHAGLFNGVTCTIFIMSFTTYCILMLVKCQYIICKRYRIPRIPRITYPETLIAALTVGPKILRPFAIRAGRILEVDDYMATHYKRTMDKSFYLMMLTVCLILMTMIRTIKTHANIALIGNCLTLFSVSIIFARSFRQWEMTSDAQFVAEPIHYPIFFGVAMFVLDSVSNIIAMENNMLTPKSFGGFLGVFNVSMMFFTFLVTLVGFFGYLRFGSGVLPMITLNLEAGDHIADMARITFAIAQILSYGMMSYIPTKLLIRRVKHSPHASFWEYFIRMIFGIVPVALAASLPKLKILPLIGALCSPILKFLVPALIEYCLKYSDKTPLFCWTVIIDILTISFGILSMIFGIYYCLTLFYVH